MSLYLFDPGLVPTRSELPPDYTFRSLSRDDYDNGVLKTLEALVYVGNLSKEQWQGRFDDMRSCPGTYFVLVIENKGKVVGTGTLVVEKKFFYDLGVQGHIEDIAISKDYQKKGLGLALLRGLNEIADKVGCYKTILDCSAKNIAFYEKCEFEQGGFEMQHYLDGRAKDLHI